MLKSVICIGPNKAMNYLIVTVFKNLGKLIIAEDVFHGMHLLQQKKDISLIIIDIDSKLKENIDFILHIHSSKLYHKPIIVLGSDHNQKANASLFDGCVYRYFVKPFNPIDLVNCINSLNALKPSTFLS